MARKLRFNRNELAGSLGDLGTLLPLAIGLVLVNGLDATGLLLSVGLFYIVSGLYFGVTVPVQPMKVIGAYAIASAMAPIEITTAGLWMAALLLVLGLFRTLNVVCRVIPKATVRGVELATGVLLLADGVQFMLGTTAFQRSRGTAEPFLEIGAVGPAEGGLLLGLVAVILILVLMENRRAPAALVVVVLGVAAGVVLGGWRSLGGMQPGLHLPDILPFGVPTPSDLVVALTALALPQLPMTIGNAVVAQADLTREYYGEDVAHFPTVVLVLAAEDTPFDEVLVQEDVTIHQGSGSSHATAAIHDRRGGSSHPPATHRAREPRTKTLRRRLRTCGV